MKGSFRSRPGEESALNPYVTSRNCFENFCIVVCGPFTPRWGIFCFWMSPYLPVCCVCCVHMCCVCATVWLDVEMKWMLRGVYWKKSAPMEPLPKLKRLETLTEIWSTKIWCDAIVVFSWQTSDLPAQSTELERRSSHPPGMCPCKRWRLSFFYFFHIVLLPLVTRRSKCDSVSWGPQWKTTAYYGLIYEWRCILFYSVLGMLLCVSYMYLQSYSSSWITGELWASGGAALVTDLSRDRRSGAFKLRREGWDNACNGHLTDSTARVQAGVHKRRSRPPQEIRWLLDHHSREGL